MGILAVNLKHYYQRRGLWFWYVIIACQLPVFFMSALDNKESVSFFERDSFMPFWVLAMASLLPGTAIWVMLKETISKPFTFCMPGHRQVLRKVVFLIGSVISMLLSLLFISCPTRTFGHALFVVLAGGFIAMMLYLLGVMNAMGRQNKIKIQHVLMFVVFGAFFVGGGKHLAAFVISSPAVVILFGVVVCAIAWRQLGRESLARKNCGKPVLGMMDRWNMDKMRRYREEMLKTKMGRQNTGIFAGLEEFFLGRMAGCEFLSMGRYVWGHVYSVMGRSFGAMRWRQLVILPILLLVGGYLGRSGSSVLDIIFIVMPLLVVTIGVNLNAYPTVLVPGGRRERAWGAVASGVTITVAAVVVVSVFAVVSMWLETILPAITVKGYDFEYAAMSFGKLSLLLIFIPLSLAVGMLFPRSMIAKFAVIIIMSQVLFVGGTLSHFDFFKPIAAINNPVSIAVFIAGAWLLYFWSIDRYFRRGQLV